MKYQDFKNLLDEKLAELGEAKNKEGKEQGADGKACWKGYKYAGTENGKDKCVKAGYEMEGGEDLSERKDMPGSQEKIDANKNGKVDAHDFALLRAKKGKKKMEEEKEVNVMPSTEDEFKKNKIKSKKDVKEGKEMTDAEMKKREKIVKSMKKGYSGFKKRYGDKAKNVMYATATKMANK